MRNTLKKSLAIIVALALCLTAFMGCLSVSADDAVNTAVVTSEAVTEGADTATAKITLTSAGFSAAVLEVSFAGLDLTDVTVNDDTVGLGHDAVDENGDEDFTAADGAIKLIVDAKDDATVALYTSMVITLTFDASKLTAGEYAVSITSVEAGIGGTYDAETSTWSGTESMVEFTTTDGNVVVNEAVTEPELVNFTLRTPVLMVQEKYGFRIRIDKNSTNGTYTDANGNAVEYDHYELLLETQEYKGSNYALTDASTTFKSSERDSSSTDARDYYFYKNVTAYALNVPIYLTVKFYDADDNYVAYSNTLEFSVAELAIAGLASTGTAANLKTMYMDMLNYGTAAQVYFSQFGTDNGLASATPINDGCDDYQTYATKDVPTLEGTSEPDDKTSSGFVTTPGLQIAASNNIYYRFTVPTTLNVEDLSVTLTHTNLYSREVTNTYSLSDLTTDSKGRYVLPYDAVALYDSSAVVTATVTNTEGTEIYSFDYNIDYYISTNITVDAYKDLFTALSKFSVSSYTYFKTLAG